MIKKILVTILYTMSVILASPFLLFINLLDLITDNNYSKFLLNIWEGK